MILFSLLQFRRGIVGGAANYISGLLDGLPDYFHYLVRADDDDAQRFTGPRIPLRMSFPVSRALRVLSLPVGVDILYRQQVERLCPELIVFPQQDVFPRRIRHPRKVVIFYDLIHRVFEDYYSGLRKLVQIALERASLREAYRVIVISEQTKDEVVRYYGVPSDRVYVLYPVIHRQAELLTEADPIGRKFILYPANSWPHKRHKLLIEAVREINVRSPRTPLTLILTGYVYRRDRHILNLCDGDHIRHLGYVSRSMLRSLYAHCSFVAFPSQYEGFGIPIIEAMTYRKRVLASDIPIFRESAGASISYFRTKEHLKSELVRLWSEEEPGDLGDLYEPRLSRFDPAEVCGRFRHYLESLI